MSNFQLRQLNRDDRGLVARLTEEHWGSRIVVAKGRVLYPEELEGFLALEDEKIVGFLTFRVGEGEFEVVTINSFVPGRGIGRSLLDAAKSAAVSAGCKRLWLITTNDNLTALKFYQKWGLQLVAVYPNAVENSRKLKPQIPLIGKDGIPIRDELELEIVLV